MRILPLVVVLAGCGEKWVLLGEDLDSALLSVREDDDGSVWAVGADAGDGPAVVRYADGAWEHLSTGDSGALWWSWGDDDAVWLVGDSGRVLRYDRAAETFEVSVVIPDATLFGVWGVPGGPIWVVGGDIAGGTGPVLYRRDGETWAEQPVPEAASGIVALYKVWGNDADDVWIVGAEGVVLRGGTAGFEAVASPTDRTLFTVHGDGDDVVLVGGEVSGVLIEADGDTLTDATPPTASQLNGVYVPSGCDAIAVGSVGSIYRRTEGEWVADEPPLLTADFHAGLVDEACGAWAVGGHLTSQSLDGGVLAYRGPDRVPPLE